MTKKLIFKPAHKMSKQLGGAVKEHELPMQYFQICSSSVLLNDGQIMSTLIYVSNRIKHKT